MSLPVQVSANLANGVYGFLISDDEFTDFVTNLFELQVFPLTDEGKDICPIPMYTADIVVPPAPTIDGAFSDGFSDGFQID